MNQTDYDRYAQFLARLDADALNTHHPHPNTNTASNTHTHSPHDDSGRSCSLSPFDIRNNSASPPGLSSGSAASHSPESLRYGPEIESWDPNEPSAASTYFDPVDILPASSDNWDSLALIQQQQSAVISPMSDYVKIEAENPLPANTNAISGYFAESVGCQSNTISPANSLLDPSARTALEGPNYSFEKDTSVLFDYNGFAQQPDPSAMIWATGTPQNDMQSQEWPKQLMSPQQLSQQPLSLIQQQQRHQQRHQQQQSSHRQQQKQQQIATQQTSPLGNSLSPSSHDSSPEYHESSEDNIHPVPKSKKRKTDSDFPDATTVDDDDHSIPVTGSRKQPKKTAHNMIEKRYRTNLNEKIAALRDSVPSLRVMAGTSRIDDDEEDLGGLAPAHKLNKATVLAKATEYIRHLEKRNKRLQEENDKLNNRLNTFEKLATMGGNIRMQPQPSLNGARGTAPGSGVSGAGGGLMSRLMVGSLAGLMVANGFQQDESGSRQLFAPVIPIEWLGSSSTAAASTSTHIFGLIFKLTLIFAAVAYVITPGFFDAKEKIETKPMDSPNVFPAPSLASPLKDRSHAWLTAIQTVWVPRHSVALELAALGLKAIKLSLRRLVGWDRYSMITGMTEEQEQARVKSWMIALDAQLAGGDVDSNHSRILLTLLASWTLPATPARLMLNSLHVHILFFDLDYGLHRFSNWLSNLCWNEARKAQEKATAVENSDDTIPENLSHLLQLEACDVFDPLIIQQAYNVAYNRETVGDCVDNGIISVVKDVSIRSPLDALAAWYSSLVLQGALGACLKSCKNPDSRYRAIQNDLDIALRVAPPTSAAHVRALVAKSVLTKHDGEKYLLEALKIFEEDFKSHDGQQSGSVPQTAATVTPLNSAVTTTTDIRVALRCAMALTLVKKGSWDEAIRLFGDMDWQPQKTDLGLLGFVAAWRTLTVLVGGPDTKWVTSKDTGDSVDRAAAMLRIWIGDKKIPKFGVSREDCKRVIDFCNSLQKRLAGLETDEDSGRDGDDGYVSGGTEVGVMEMVARANEMKVCVKA